jgi:hypothetical protein
MSLRFERQTRETLAYQFKMFSRNECRLSRSAFYEAVCAGIARDGDLLDLAGNVRVGQRAPNLFLAAVHYLVLTRDETILKGIYEDVSRGIPAPGDFYTTFRQFCLDNDAEIAGIISRRTVQTNEVRRCATFLPALFLVADRTGRRPFHFVDVGCSAGLNLLWDRYYYRYSNGVSCGDESSTLHLTCDVRGDTSPPLRKELPEAASRVGIEIEPVDVTGPDNVAWLQALIWPDQRERRELLGAALAVFRKDPPRIVGGDCVEKIPRVVGELPDGEPVCLLFSHSVNQAFPDGRRGLSALLEGLSPSRTIFEVSLGNFEERAPELILSTYERGRAASEARLATCHPHGSWVRWNR